MIDRTSAARPGGDSARRRIYPGSLSGGSLVRRYSRGGGLGRRAAGDGHQGGVTCAFRRRGGRAWRVRRDLEVAAAVLAAASRGRRRWGGGRSVVGAAGWRDGGKIGGGFSRVRWRRLGRTSTWAAVVRARRR